MSLRAVRIPLTLQIAAVVALFAAASAALWYTGTSIVKREERRASARRVLAEATEALVERGTKSLTGVRRWPDLAEPAERQAMSRRLAAEAEAAMASFPGVEGGYFLREEGRFLPDFPEHVTSDEVANVSPTTGAATDENDLYDMVETQVDAAIRKRRGMSVVEDISRSRPLAVRGDRRCGSMVRSSPPRGR